MTEMKVEHQSALAAVDHASIGFLPAPLDGHIGLARCVIEGDLMDNGEKTGLIL